LTNNKIKITAIINIISLEDLNKETALPVNIIEYQVFSSQ